MHSLASALFVSGARPVFPETSATADTLDRVLHHARRLHRAARSSSVAAAMPVIRRIHAVGVFPELSVVGLYRARASLQRKHVLRMMAIEAGHAGWEGYRAVLPTLALDAIAPWHLSEHVAAGLNVWFSNEAEARAALGDAVTLRRYGTQVVVDGAVFEPSAAASA